MLIIKILIYTLIFLSCSVIGVLISKKYLYRVEELKDFKLALNMLKTKIKYTYDTLPEIFVDISNNIESNVGRAFKISANKMDILEAGKAWETSLDLIKLNITEEDKKTLNNLSKLLGETDIDGQISQIEITKEYLDKQIEKADEDKKKSEKMYKTLGMIIGIGIVIVLV